jgi:hypothetical protein
VGKVPQAQIDEWSEETEIREGQGATRAGGRLRAEILRTSDFGAARQMETKLKAWGFPAMLETIGGGYGASEYSVYIGGVASEKDKDSLAVRVKNTLSGTSEKTPTSKPATKY